MISQFCIPLVHQQLARKNFYYFLERSFSIINPGEIFSSNWHIAVMADYLSRVAQGKITRLIINVPPRSLKSICASVAFPAWLLGKNPSNKIVVASYNNHLSYKHALDSRHLILSPFYKSIFPEMLISADQNQKYKFITSERGSRFATSINGTITGEGGNILIVDDPHNALDIYSQVKRQKVHRWFGQSFSSRLDDKKKGAIIIVMQRLHHEDLTGFILDNQPKTWHHLIIPAISPEDKIYYDGGCPYYFREGELLHQDREGYEEIERAKSELGSFAFTAQYLQKPIVNGAGMIKSSWLRYFHSEPIFLSVILSWDTAIKTAQNNSYSVCTCWGETKDSFYLLDVNRQKLEYPELKRQIIVMIEKWKPNVSLIEDKASGQTLLQDLQRETNFPFIAMKPVHDKITRFARITPLFEAGKVFLPKYRSWCADYESEIMLFPCSIYSDQVDSTSQYFSYIFNRNIAKPSVRSIL
jgi:predicted phage terminase large subunit-like protein